MNRACYTIKAKDYNNVMCYFYSNYDNRNKIISEALGLHVGYVNHIIDFALKEKRNYMGGKFITKDRAKIYKGTKIEVYGSCGIIGRYASISAAARDLNISPVVISERLKNTRRHTMKHHDGRVLTYVKC